MRCVNLQGTPYSYTYVQTCADVCMYNYMSKIKFHIKDKGVF